MRRTKFNKLWLQMPEFSKWLECNKNDESLAYCKFCMIKIELGNMGKKAISSHYSSKKHKNIEGSMVSNEANALLAWRNRSNTTANNSGSTLSR